MKSFVGTMTTKTRLDEDFWYHKSDLDSDSPEMDSESDSFWLNPNQPDPLQDVLWDRGSGYFVMRSDHDSLSVMDLYWNPKISFKLVSIEPDFPIGGVINPEDVRFIVVEDSYPLRMSSDPYAREFAENFFRTLNVEHAGWAIEYFPPPSSELIRNGGVPVRDCERDSFHIENLNDLLEAFRNRDRFTGKDYRRINDYELHHYYVEQVNGLMAMRYYVDATLPDAIILSPDRWLELLQEWVASPEKYPNDTHRALAAIPLIIGRQGHYCRFKYEDEWGNIIDFVESAINHIIRKLPRNRNYRFKREKLEEMMEIIDQYRY